MSKKFTKTNFQQWLESKSARTKVGNTVSYDKTPLVRFIKESNLNVDLTSLPKWAEDFQSKVLGRNGASISANAALTLLS